MSNCTRFSLEISPSEPEVWEALNENEEIAARIDEDGTSVESSRWYDHEDEMRSFSEQFPHVLFTLSGEGEENGDLWKKYFRNGKMQAAPAKITYAEFDESLLT